MTKLTFKSSGGDFKQPEAGTYPVTIVVAADIGTQPDDVIRGTGPNAGKAVEGGPRLMFNFELVGHDSDSEHPTTLLKEVTLSFGEKSALVGLAKSFLGLNYESFKKLVKEGKADLGLFLGKSALAVVGIGSTGRARLEGFMPLMKGTSVPAPKSELLLFDIDDVSNSVFSKLPKLIQTKIEQSEERKEASSSSSDFSGDLDL